MTPADVAQLRLRFQRLASKPFAHAEEAVAFFGAVQSQDFAGATWALSLRTGLDTATIETAFAEGRLLRTHVLRPTWHFVSPADLRWMVSLTADRIRTKLATRDRQLDIDAALVTKAEKILAKALARGPLTRTELAATVEEAGIETGSGEAGCSWTDASLGSGSAP